MDAVPAEENIICRCFVVTEYVIRQAVRDGKLKHVEQISSCTNAGNGCQSCWPELQDILDQMWNVKRPVEVKDPKESFTVIQKRGLIVRVLHKEMSSLFELNGVKAELVDVKTDRAHIRFTGSVVGTQESSFLSMKRQLVRAMTQACGRPMLLVEVNVLEKHRANTRTQP